jgi:hypothetical protein
VLRSIIQVVDYDPDWPDRFCQGNDNAFWVSLSTGSGFTLAFLGIKHGGSFLPVKHIM